MKKHYPSKKPLFDWQNYRAGAAKPSSNVELLQSLKHQYDAHPSWGWKKESEVDLLLGMNYVQVGQTELALPLFDGILMKNPTVRSWISATASLQTAQIRLKQWKEKNLSREDPDTLKILAQLKTLILQKNLVNEPIHLDAAIEYIDFQTGLETEEKRTRKTPRPSHQNENRL